MQKQPKKTKWFYYDETGEKIGPLRGRELKQLAAQGIVTPETPVENTEGKTALAEKVKGLCFSSPTSDPAVASSIISAPKKTTWFYYDATGEKIGPFTNREFKNLAGEGVVMPETRIENAEGQCCLAKDVAGLQFAPDEEPDGPIDDHDTVFNFEDDDEDEYSPFGIEDEQVAQVVRETLARATQKKSVIDEPEEKLDSPIIRRYVWLRENFALHKVKILTGIVAVTLLLVVAPWIFGERVPPGIIYLEGIVTLDGVPVSGVNVILHPRDREGTSAGGMTNARGRFRVTTHPAPVGSGAKAGEYDVTFSKMEIVETTETEEIARRMEMAEIVRRLEIEGIEGMVEIDGTLLFVSDFPHEHTEEFDTRRHIIPQRYGRVGTSGLEPITVEAGGRNRFTFALSSE